MFPKMFNPSSSLYKRVISSSLVGTVLLLVCVGSLIIWLFNQSLTRSIYDQLSAFNDILIASTTIENGKVVIKEPEMLRLLPRYWQVQSAGKVVASSSLLPHKLDLKEYKEHWTFVDREGSKVLADVSTVFFPNNIKVVYIFGMQEDIADLMMASEKSRFLWSLGGIFIFLMVAVGVLAKIQLTSVMDPIDRIGSELKLVQEGEIKRLRAENIPQEIRPLTDQVNALLDYVEEVIGRYRMFASNLSHALKTPLSVMVNEASLSKGKLADTVKEKASVLQLLIDRNLARVKMSGNAKGIHGRCDLKQVLDRIGSNFAKLYDSRICVDVQEEVPLFKGDEHDLYEMLGNLIENACRYGKGVVRVRAYSKDDSLQIRIEDNGQGIDPTEYQEVLKRGKRLDETKPGTGIGLSISHDIACLYSGSLHLDRSELGGLSVTVSLPLEA